MISKHEYEVLNLYTKLQIVIKSRQSAKLKIAKEIAAAAKLAPPCCKSGNSSSSNSKYGRWSYKNKSWNSRTDNFMLTFNKKNKEFIAFLKIRET